MPVIKSPSDGGAHSARALHVVREDDVHASGDSGLVAMAVRQDSAAALAGTTGDYSPLSVDSTGRLHISGAATLAAGAVSLPSTVYHGKTTVTTAGTQVTLTTTQTIVTGVTVKAGSTNTDLIYVGASGVSSTDGLELNQNEQVFIAIDDLTTVWVDSAVNGEHVTWIAT